MIIYRVNKKTLSIDIFNIDTTGNGYYIDKNKKKHQILSSNYVYFTDISKCRVFVSAVLIQKQIEATNIITACTKLRKTLKEITNEDLI